MNVKTGFAVLAIGCAAAFAVPQPAQAAPYVSASYYDGNYAPRYPVRYCYDAYGYRYYCGPTYDYGYYRPYYPAYYGPRVSIGFGYGRGYYGWGHGWDHWHGGGHWGGGHDGHHWHR